MTRSEWLGGTDPGHLVGLLGERASERKLRLFACACCRRIWPLLHAAGSRRAVEVAERFADGGASDDELARARAAARAVTWSAVKAAQQDCPSKAPGAGRRIDWVAVWAACAAEETAETNLGRTRPDEGVRSSSLALPDDGARVVRTAAVAAWTR